MAAGQGGGRLQRGLVRVHHGRRRRAVLQRLRRHRRPRHRQRGRIAVGRPVARRGRQLRRDDAADLRRRRGGRRGRPEHRHDRLRPAVRRPGARQLPRHRRLRLHLRLPGRPRPGLDLREGPDRRRGRDAGQGRPAGAAGSPGAPAGAEGAHAAARTQPGPEGRGHRGDAGHADLRPAPLVDLHRGPTDKAQEDRRPRLRRPRRAGGRRWTGGPPADGHGAVRDRRRRARVAGQPAVPRVGAEHRDDVARRRLPDRGGAQLGDERVHLHAARRLDPGHGERRGRALGSGLCIEAACGTTASRTLSGVSFRDPPPASEVNLLEQPVVLHAGGDPNGTVTGINVVKPRPEQIFQKLLALSPLNYHFLDLEGRPADWPRYRATRFASDSAIWEAADAYDEASPPGPGHGRGVRDRRQPRRDDRSHVGGDWQDVRQRDVAARDVGRP